MKPETILKWHWELIRRKWTFKQAQRGGRSRIDMALEVLIVHPAHDKIQQTSHLMSEHFNIHGGCIRGKTAQFSRRIISNGKSGLVVYGRLPTTAHFDQRKANTVQTIGQAP